MVLILFPLQFISSTEIAITKDFSFDASPDKYVPSPWRAEPGPLKIVAIDNGAGRVELNPEVGGVVVATVLADVMIQPNEDLNVYQSTEQIQVTGSGFDNDIQARFCYCGDPVVSFRLGLCLQATVLIRISCGSWLHRPSNVTRNPEHGLVFMVLSFQVWKMRCTR